MALVLLWSLGLAVAQAAPAERFSNTLGMEFVLIPAGSFPMGSPADEPGRGKDENIHPVTISRPFYMQITEVTLGQWRDLMGRRLFGRRRGPNNFPVTKVSYYDALDFIAKLNQKGEGTYRLPTEAEWEYAARAGTTSAYSFGATIECSQAMFGNNPLKDDQCLDYYQNQRRCRPSRPTRVAAFLPNRWGLHDMHGNVWEWCSDWYGPYPSSSLTDPKGPSEGTHRVRRGGSWFRGPYALRSANRNLANPASRYPTLGFRVVREVE
jgi:formylglycine-generating enzyme required for sulfatase activity